jgi:hypothetical protein
MRVISAAALLGVLLACRKPYYPAGGPGALDFSGEYELSESVYSNSCGPAIVARKNPLRVKVEHASGGGFAKIIVEDRLTYDASVRSNGNFVVSAAQGADRGSGVSRTISGNFTESAMFARVTVDTLRPLPPASRPLGGADQAERNCRYQLHWAGKRL